MKEESNSIAVIGHGNVGGHLVEGFIQSGVEITHVVTSKDPLTVELRDQRIELIDSPQKLPDNQLVIVCVPDDHIAEVLQQIPSSCPVAYTAGSVELESLPQRENLGVFYPLQTFSKGIDVNLFEVPFFIEANNVDFAKELFDLAWKLSRTVNFATSEERKKLHLAAVWVNNFTNHVNHIAQDYLAKNDLEFKHLIPLLKETVRKLQEESPFNAQTGPAKRGDEHVIQEHLSMLNGNEKKIYELISRNIQATYNDKL